MLSEEITEQSSLCSTPRRNECEHSHRVVSAGAIAKTDSVLLDDQVFL
jgi:hypothetical protein